MKTLDLLVAETALKWSQDQQKIWLCTVLHTYGSAPRSPGALFVANSQGQYLGSLSGGCIEEDFLQKIQEGWFTKKSDIAIYGEQSEHFRPNTTLPCGGTIDVLVEYLLPTPETTHYLTNMIKALSGQKTMMKRLTVGSKAILQEEDVQDKPRVYQSENNLEITLQSDTTIFIAGISAVALYCIEFAVSLGFMVIVTEDRPEELRQLNEIAQRDAITILKTFPAQYIETEGASAQTAILSLTHDPRIDDFTMIAALDTPAFYIGAMGSRRNSELRLQRLKECTDYSDDVLSRIHAPIGLPIGSKTPAEIALAIMADIVMHKNGAMPSA